MVRFIHRSLNEDVPRKDKFAWDIFSYDSLTYKERKMGK